MSREELKVIINIVSIINEKIDKLKISLYNKYRKKETTEVVADK